MIKQTIPPQPKPLEQQPQEPVFPAINYQCTLCGSQEPWNCTECMGAMTVPPYSVHGKKFIGSGEDAFLC